MDEAIDTGAEEMLKGYGGLRCELLVTNLNKGESYSVISTEEEMVILELLAFSIASKELGQKEIKLNYRPSETPLDIIERHQLFSDNFQNRFRVAVNDEFADWDRECGIIEQMAIIPPVSGG